MALVIFLRGVNVGGHRTFRPSALATELKQYGVVNIGAAGTFVVTKPISEKRLRAELLRHLPFETHVMICAGHELLAAVAEHPFDAEPSRPDIVRFVNVLSEPPQTSHSTPILIPDEGRWLLKIVSIHQRFVFGVYRREMKAIRCFNQMDKLFGSPGTIRNWNTIGAILKVLGKTSGEAHGASCR
ncbi:MAG TPA: DUF1697 domain-containing protein [Candidatus Angelobacter sp.]|nr:DUF1697 domain-containing protein [Candidatus Angelobacter sp.]